MDINNEGKIIPFPKPRLVSPSSVVEEVEFEFFKKNLDYLKHLNKQVSELIVELEHILADESFL